MITKDDLKLHGSNYYKKFEGQYSPQSYLVTKDDEGDPGRIVLKVGYPFSCWPLIMKYNNIVDPFKDLKAGNIIFIPMLRDLSGL